MACSLLLKVVEVLLVGQSSDLNTASNFASMWLRGFSCAYFGPARMPVPRHTEQHDDEFDKPFTLQKEPRKRCV